MRKGGGKGIHTKQGLRKGEKEHEKEGGEKNTRPFMTGAQGPFACLSKGEAGGGGSSALLSYSGILKSVGGLLSGSEKGRKVGEWFGRCCCCRRCRLFLVVSMHTDVLVQVVASREAFRAVRVRARERY